MLRQVKLLFFLAVVFVLQYGFAPYIATQGGPDNATTVPILRIVGVAFDAGEWGYAAALSTTLLVIMVLMSGADPARRAPPRSERSIADGRRTRATIAGCGRRPLTRRRLTDLAVAAILSCLAFVGLFPYLYMLETAVKSNSQFISNEATPTWPFHLGNFATAWREVAPYLLSSIIVAACAMFGCILLGSVSGFVLARYRFPGRNLFFGLIALLLMVPNMASLIPLFVLMRDLRSAQLLPRPDHPAAHHPDGLLRGAHEDIYRAPARGAVRRGPDRWRVAGTTYWSITLPLARPIIGTVALFSVISVWSDYFWPELTIVTNSLRTVPVGVQFFQGELTTSYGPLFAGYLIASPPLLILFVALARNFLAGIQGGLAMER